MTEEGFTTALHSVLTEHVVHVNEDQSLVDDGKDMSFIRSVDRSDIGIRVSLDDGTAFQLIILEDP